MKRLLILLAFSVGCAGIPRPKGDVCQIDSPRSELICLDMEKDIDDDGKKKPDAKPHRITVLSLDDLDKYTVFSPEAWSEVKIFLGRMKNACKDSRELFGMEVNGGQISPEGDKAQAERALQHD